MQPATLNNPLIDGYLAMLKTLSAADKLDLIARLSASVKSDLETPPSRFQQAFGALESEQTAEEIIREIRAARV